MTHMHLGLPSHTGAMVPMRDWADFAAATEDDGFDALWHSNERFFRDMFVRMTVSATATRRIMLGGAVVDGFALHPALTAQSLATVDELSAGRVTVAVGAGGSGLPMMGITRRAVPEVVRTTYLSIAQLLEGETVTCTTPLYTLDKAHLRVRPAGTVPMWVASRGPRTLEMAGGVADGVIVASQATAPGLLRSLGHVARGVAAAGRTPDAIATMARVDTCVHADPNLARDGCRLMVAKMLWMSYPDRGFVTDAGLAVPDELEKIIATRDYDALEKVASLVPDELIDSFCWAGTPDQIVDRVADVVDATGVTDVGFWLLCAPGQSLTEARAMLAGVLPALRSRLGTEASA